jgi:hypothetical protein
MAYGNAGIKALEKPEVARCYLVRGGTLGSRFVKGDPVRALIYLVDAQLKSHISFLHCILSRKDDEGSLSCHESRLSD